MSFVYRSVLHVCRGVYRCVQVCTGVKRMSKVSEEGVCASVYKCVQVCNG